jgi:hypothetical protein
LIFNCYCGKQEEGHGWLFRHLCPSSCNQPCADWAVRSASHIIDLLEAGKGGSLSLIGMSPERQINAAVFDRRLAHMRLRYVYSQTV